ncbi:hypothetical protein [Paludisphaera borealis]|uniref:Uncharacterized protein n=1 Tax=Paludisphaera borealis TaxID=1387353 RepID=A0A1U7CK34_9BACT|nr:hypothetical protein [Paludisphaera borealis]APW59292.1 hypothetical protein BSF38_00708 [Paludisphaera borealis]
MPATVARDQGKSTFIKQTLFDDQYANSAKINELWTESGRDGSISTTLVNKMRSEMGLTGNLRGVRGTTKRSAPAEAKRPYTGKKRGRKPKSALATVAANATEDASASARIGLTASAFRGRNARLNRLVDVEADIDRLLFKVMGLDGLSEVEDTLRQARRLLYRVIG